MSNGGLKIFISSIMQDQYFQDLRKKTIVVIINLHHSPVFAEEFLPAEIEQDTNPRSKIEREIKQCDCYLGIFHEKWGYVPKKNNPKNQSVTAIEYEIAKEKGYPMLIFKSNSKNREKQLRAYPKIR